MKFNEFLKLAETAERSKPIVESSLSKLWRKYFECDSGTISACRDTSTYKENRLNTLRLKTDLIRKGYSVTTINGRYIENYGKPNATDVNERSFIVFDTKKSGELKKDLLRLGEKYNQDSVTYCNAADGKYVLIGTNKTGYPGYQNEVFLGKPHFGEKGEMHSSINGRPFVFESASHLKTDYDCSITSYNLSTIQCLKHFGDDYVLSH